MMENCQRCNALESARDFGLANGAIPATLCLDCIHDWIRFFHGSEIFNEMVRSNAKTHYLEVQIESEEPPDMSIYLNAVKENSEIIRRAVDLAFQWLERGDRNDND